MPRDVAQTRLWETSLSDSELGADDFGQALGFSLDDVAVGSLDHDPGERLGSGVSEDDSSLGAEGSLGRFHRGAHDRVVTENRLLANGNV